MSVAAKENLVPVVEKAISGDKEAFETLFRRYWNMAYYYCVRYLKNKSEAEEVAQDAFFVLSCNIKNLNNPDLFVAYFMRILTNTCHNRSKTRKYMYNNSMLFIDTFTNTLPEEKMEFIPGEAMVQQEIREELIAHIETLPKKQREVMLMYYLSEMSQSEIAAALDIKPSAVGNRLHHAKKSLEKKLSKKTSKGLVHASVVPIPLIIFLLREDMARVATPDVEARAWEGLQSQISAYEAGSEAGELSAELPKSNPSALLVGSIIALACAAVICFGIVAAYYLGTAEPDTGSYAIVLEVNTYDILEELRAATTLEDFNDFVARHGFEAGQVVTWQGQNGASVYRLYQRNFNDMVIFTGIRSSSYGVLIVYETAAPGAAPPQNVVDWIEKLTG